MSLFIGLMSGTSLDGIDAALVEIREGGTPRLVATHDTPMPETLRDLLWRLCHADRVAFSELAAAEDAFCRLQAAAVEALIASSGVERAAISAIGSHGQTIEHAPRGHDGGPAYTLQLDNPSLLAEPFFHLPPPRSTGRELFHLDWLQGQLQGGEAPQDVQATLAELTAASVALGVGMARERLDAPPAALLVPCGGGAHNPDLLSRLASRLPETPLVPGDDWGWPAEWLEAGAFAWLAWRRLAGLPGNLPSVTGAAGPRVLGGVYSP